MKPLLLLMLLVVANLARGATLTVDSAADGPSTSDGRCTLREAIMSINAGAAVTADCVNSGAAYGTSDTIAFNIPAASDPGCNAGTGVCTIAPLGLSVLSLNKTVLIDGYTQPGAAQNTLAGGAYPNAHGLNMQIKIELDGNSLLAGTGNLGFGPAASNSEVRGLAIYGFQGNCLSFGGSNNLIDGNIIGLRADGTTIPAGRQCQNGVALGNAQSGNVIGGFTPASRNLIANATGAGINISFSNSNVIAHNLIGTDITGTQGRAYSFAHDAAFGIYVLASLGVSHTAIDSNVIADWGLSGILLGGADHSSIARNAIGIGVGGVLLGNGLTGTGSDAGVDITTYSGLASTNNTVYLNGIAASAGDGIRVLGDAAGDPSGNQLDRNLIFSNGGLGINLQPVGEAIYTVTANDSPASLDADSGPNGLQNYPIISSASVNMSGGVDIAYTLDSGANAIYSISAYASTSCSWTGNGEGRYLAGPPLSWITDGSGHLAQTFTYGSMPANWAAGQWVSLLATDSNGNTSEFSPCVKIAASASTPPVMADVPDQNATVGTAIAALNLAGYVTATDGDPILSYAYTGSLPPGLNFNTTSGVISGTPSTAGTYNISVTVSDKDGASNADAIRITVSAAANHPPVANADSYATPNTQILNVSAASGVLANDSDADGNTLTAVLASGPSHAQSFTLHADGSFSYTVAGAYTGPDSFSYYANDGSVNSATAATVTLNITAAPPGAASPIPTLSHGGLLILALGLALVAASRKCKARL